MFHIIFPVLTIGLSVFLLLTELLWVLSGKKEYYCHARFWGRLFILNFGIGVVTGVVMEFQFGTNWAEFSRFSGGFFGNILGYEAALAFAAESAFLSLMIFGWDRISKWMHLFATFVVAFAATFSAVWIMDANSWMQAPTGVELIDGRLNVIDYGAAIFNPFFVVSFFHKWFACVQITLLFVGGISAWYLIAGRNAQLFTKSFKLAVISAIIAAPLQIYLGDWSGRVVTRYQPEKGAAMESHWQTNSPGQGASWALVAWPDENKEKNSFQITIPNVLSLLATHSITGKVTGLKDFPPPDRPPIVLPFYAFRIMVGLGFYFFALMVVTVWVWWKHGLTDTSIVKYSWLFRIWVWSIPLGYAAMEVGWIVREVGRQPWSIYRLLRTSEGLSRLTGSEVLLTLLIYLGIYALLFWLFVVSVIKIIRKGPDPDIALPAYTKMK
jgi:cytochrome d ubiquinol oxidase subunit I